jgi:hypothetical protein
VLAQFWDILLEKFDAFGETQARKLYGLAVAVMLASSTHRPYVLQRMDMIVSVMVSCLLEFHGSNDDGNMTLTDSMVQRCPSPLNEDAECNPEYVRQQQLMARDPVYCVALIDYAGANMSALLGSFSPDDQTKFFSRAVLDEVEQLRNYMRMAAR